jgi:2-polyprenyl-3-methyl-5-hydroxy-6-metoxy-1,4-benzoquinol methylase
MLLLAAYFVKDVDKAPDPTGEATVEEGLSEKRLLSMALEMFKDSWATHTIPGKVEEPSYDRPFAERICGLIYAKCGGDADAYGSALRDFILLSEEFVTLQMELDRTGHYLYSSFDEVRERVYDNAALMDGQYLNGLFLSEAFWVNHSKIFAYFVEAFCNGNPTSGTVLEVPSGPGLFISEFARRNPGWDATAMDLSQSAVNFSMEIARLNAGREVSISRADVFELPDSVGYDRIICGELLEHLENPEQLLEKLASLMKPGGRIFLTTAIWAASIDHIYLFKSAREVREMLARFTIDSELALTVRDGFSPEDERTPINYACVLSIDASFTER